MSESSDSDSKSTSTLPLEGDTRETGICRDFQRGFCDRVRCKFKHEKSSDSTSTPTLVFCHDFQNNSCPRPSCKFIHCSVAEEEQYKKTGELPPHLQLDAVRKQQISMGSSLPVCKNYLNNGECRRQNSCKFRHLTQAQYETEIRRLIKTNSDFNRFPNKNNNFDQYFLRNTNEQSPQINYFRNGGVRRNVTENSYNSFDEYGPPEPKRRILVPNNIEFLDANGFRIPDSDLDSRSLHLKNYFNATQNPDSNISKDARIILLEEENVILHKQIADLKKQVSDLTATNEFLLDQNAQFRVSNKRNQANVTSVTVPAVTITNTTNNTPTQPPQQVIRTVTASVATVPVSIATVTAGSPVSIAGVSMAPVQAVPAVSIAQPAAQQIIAQSQQLLANPTSQITLANNSQAQLAIAQQNLANNLAAAQQNQPITNQQLTSQAQQLALANNTQLTSQAQQLALAASTPQLIAAQQNLATSQQMALTNSNQMNAAINTSQAIAMSNATQPMVSYPIMTQSVLQNALPH